MLSFFGNQAKVFRKEEKNTILEENIKYAGISDRPPKSLCCKASKSLSAVSYLFDLGVPQLQGSLFLQLYQEFL